MIDKPNITGIILAGGKSSRMGSDKGFVLLNGKPFVAHIIQALKPLVTDIIIVSNNTDYDVFNEIRINDIINNSGPLAGLYSGLSQSKTDLNIVLSCDVPLITTSVLKLLVDTASQNFDIIQAQYKNETMPLIAIYHKKCVQKTKELLDQGEKRLRSLAKHFNTGSLLIEDAYEKSIRNINTNEQLKLLINEIKN